MIRIVSGLLLVALVLAVLFVLPPWGTLALALVALVLGTLELAELAEHGHSRLPRVLMTVAAGATLVALARLPPLPAELPILAALIATGAALVGEGRTDVDVMRRVGVMLLPIVYLALPIAAMVAIRRDHGALVLLALIATTVVSDTAQYFGGRAMGRRRLAPRISPKKTLEGAISGVVAGSVVVPVAGAFLWPGIPFWALWPIGMALVGLGIVGDLFESLLKRSVGMKDSSQLIPGHGGVLDRIDSLLFAAPFYYGVLRAIA